MRGAAIDQSGNERDRGRTRPDDHDVLAGDLGIVGVPGEVYTPDEGKHLPAIAFGHGWMNQTARYRDLVHHLASWGIVVALPAGQGGVLASDVGLAADLRSVSYRNGDIEIFVRGRDSLIHRFSLVKSLKVGVDEK